MPETINAQQLCGEHIRRIIQFTIPQGPTESVPVHQPPAPVAGEVAAVSHDGRGVSVALRGIGGSFREANFLLRSVDLVVVDAFEVVQSR